MLTVLALNTVLGGCVLFRNSSEHRETSAVQPASGVREVRAGDTLYSIAWESGHDFQELAEWNDIDVPYVIKPGQQIRLSPPPAARSTSKSSFDKESPKDSFYTVTRGDTLYGIAKKQNLRYQDLAAWNNIKAPYMLSPGQRLRLAPPVKTVGTPRAILKPSASRRLPASDDDDGDNQSSIRWAWPTEGAVIARFASSGTNKGIDIAGKAGQPVRAAAPGKIVYQGSGLRGYGQLIIVKHNSDFLSAYAHCGAIYAKEASVIKPGDVICAMGSSGTDRVKLHFEIRRRGVPVDPMDFLPNK